MTLRNLLVRVGADVSGLKKGLQSAQKDVRYFGRNVTGSLKEMQRNMTATLAVFGGGFLAKSAISDAMRFESLMATLSESLGSSMKQFEEWQGTVGTAMGFSRLQSADLANILSLNFKRMATSQADLTAKTTRMMEIAGIVSNKRGMTMQEVSDRIRSAMNQEADSADELGVNVRAVAIKSSKAYKEMANGQPFDQLSESMRKTILYHHIIEQVTENLGDTMQDTTSLRMAQFVAIMADVRMALGQAFLPILHTVLPILTSLGKGLYKIMQIISAFTRSLFGGFKFKSPVDKKAIDDSAKSVGALGDSATKAGKASVKSAKATKKAWSGLFGFDEVNTVNDSDTGGGAGGGGGGGAVGGLGDMGIGDEPSGYDTEAYVESLSELVAKMDTFTKPIREAFSTAFDYVATYLKEKIAEMKGFWAENGDSIIKAGQNVLNFILPVFSVIGKYVLDSFRMILEGALTAFGGIIKFLSGVFTGDFALMWEGVKDTFWGVVELMFGFFNLTFIGGIRKALVELLAKGIKKIWTFADDFKKIFSGGLSNVKKYWGLLYTKVKTVLSDMKKFIDGRVELMQTSFRTLWTKVESWAKTAWKGIKNVFKGVVEWFTRTIITPIVDKIGEIRDAFSEGMGKGFKTIINSVITGINNGIRAINKVKNGLPFGEKIGDIPTIPKLAQGGITNGATLAMVGDNVGGREVISPLDRLESMLTNSVIQAMQLGGGNTQQSSGDIVLNIDGRAFARVVKPFMDREENRRGSDVRIRTM